MTDLQRAQAEAEEARQQALNIERCVPLWPVLLPPPPAPHRSMLVRPHLTVAALHLASGT